MIALGDQMLLASDLKDHLLASEPQDESRHGKTSQKRKQSPAAESPVLHDEDCPSNIAQAGGMHPFEKHTCSSKQFPMESISNLCF